MGCGSAGGGVGPPRVGFSCGRRVFAGRLFPLQRAGQGVEPGCDPRGIPAGQPVRPEALEHGQDHLRRPRACAGQTSRAGRWTAAAAGTAATPPGRARRSGRGRASARPTACSSTRRPGSSRMRTAPTARTRAARVRSARSPDDGGGHRVDAPFAQLDDRLPQQVVGSVEVVEQHLVGGEKTPSTTAFPPPSLFWLLASTVTNVRRVEVSTQLRSSRSSATSLSVSSESKSAPCHGRRCQPGDCPAHTRPQERRGALPPPRSVPP